MTVVSVVDTKMYCQSSMRAQTIQQSNNDDNVAAFSIGKKSGACQPMHFCTKASSSCSIQKWNVNKERRPVQMNSAFTRDGDLNLLKHMSWVEQKGAMLVAYRYLSLKPGYEPACQSRPQSRPQSLLSSFPEGLPGNGQVIRRQIPVHFWQATFLWSFPDFLSGLW